MENLIKIKKLITDVKELKKLKNEKEKLIEQTAMTVLKELMTIENWKVMIDSCLEHLNSYKNPIDFFNACHVIYFNDCISWIKGYSDGSDYSVLTVNLTTTLESQVENRIRKLADKKQKELEQEKMAEIEIYERIKRKYNL